MKVEFFKKGVEKILKAIKFSEFEKAASEWLKNDWIEIFRMSSEYDHNFI